MLAHALGVMGLLRHTQRQQNDIPPAHALVKATASIGRGAFNAQALSLLARHLLPAADAREARVLAACICGAALELGPSQWAPRAAAGLVDGLSRHVDARQEASEQERQVFACVLAAMQTWDKQRRDLLPRHVLVLVSSFVRAELADALVLRAAANMLEARSDWLPTPRVRHPFKPLATAPRAAAGRSGVGGSSGSVGEEGGGGGITAIELSGIATASTKMMLLITAHAAARALQTAAAATAAGPASSSPRSPASTGIGGRRCLCPGAQHTTTPAAGSRLAGVSGPGPISLLPLALHLSLLPPPSPLSPLTDLSGASLRHPVVHGAVHAGAGG
jgi:hypothetical protein